MVLLRTRPVTRLTEIFGVRVAGLEHARRFPAVPGGMDGPLEALKDHLDGDVERDATTALGRQRLWLLAEDGAVSARARIRTGR
jgi:hypothetical protein